MTEKIQPYLPKWATTAEACAYLEAQTGEAWPLVRLLESWLKPSIWLEYSPDAPPELFGDRFEGIFAPLVFANDTGRMAHTRSGLLTMSKLPDGCLFRVSPGIPFDLDELRYSRADLLQLVQGHEPQAASQTGERAPAKTPSEIAKRHAELKRARVHGYTKQTAKEFDCSERWVTNCVKKEKSKPPSSMGDMRKQLE